MRDILDRCGVSKSLFAEIVGASYVMVWHWEKGTRAMTGKKGQRASKLLDLMQKAANLGLFGETPRNTTRTQLVAAIKTAATQQ